MTLGEKIYTLRKAKGWSQDYVAEQLDVSRQSVSRWELDESVPELQKVYKLSTLFSVSCDALLNEQLETISPVVQEPSTAKQNSKTTKKVFAVLSVLCGVVLLGTLAVLSAVVPSYIKSTQTVSRTDIAVPFSDEVPDWEPEHNAVTSRIEVHAFFPFLSTYHLFWLAGIAVCLILYGMVSLVRLRVKQKKKTLKKQKKTAALSDGLFSV